VSTILAAASEVLTWLSEDQWPACIIGGLAVQRWGEPRLTRDVDLTVIVALGSEERMVDRALSHFAARREDARAFALRYRVLLVRASNGVALDLALGATGFEIESVTRSSPWEIEPGRALRTCSAEDLIVHKLVAGRPRDGADIEGIVARQRGRLDVGRIRRWADAFAELTEHPELSRPFEAALARARTKT
jgi:hypothetical protein